MWYFWFDFASDVSIEGRLTSEHLRLHSPVEQQFMVSHIVLHHALCYLCTHTLSDLVRWVLWDWWHQRMGVAILISSSLSPFCARGQNSRRWCDATCSTCLQTQWDLSAAVCLLSSVDWRDQNLRDYMITLAPSLSLFFNNFLDWKCIDFSLMLSSHLAKK